MILAPKYSLLTLIVTFGRSYLLRRLLPTTKVQPVALDRARNAVPDTRLDFNKASPLPEDH
jgi:hypothetical protein